MANSRVLLSIGHGYSANKLSQKLIKNQDWKVIGTHRSKKMSEDELKSGISERIWPGSDLFEEMSEATHILSSVPPMKDGDPVIRLLGEQFANLSTNLTWVGYFSTTAVYGDKEGGWVDESATLYPNTKRGQQRVDAERAWINLADKFGFPLHIFRLAGIYGSGRGPLAQIQSGRKKNQVIKSNQIFNRIHVEDISRIVIASMNNPETRAIYNVCDDCPAPPEIVADYACQLLNRAPLPRVLFQEAELSPMARSFYAESKRVSNQLVKQRLGLKLKYPDYKSGIKSLI